MFAKKQPEIYGVLLEKLDQNKISTDKAIHQMERLQLKEKLLKQKPDLELPDGVKLYNGDFRQCSIQIPDNSIDLVLTDPPYSEKSLSLYKDVSDIAQRVLKPGGSLITYCGTCLIPEIIKYLNDGGLRFHWIIALKLRGPYSKFWGANVTIKWKPMLWFVKGNKANIVDFVGDLIESSTPDKTSHEWEQSTVEAEHIISRLTVENQVVLDPLMGSGTTGIAALKLNRKFIGIEIDSQTFAIARSNIGNMISDTSFVHTPNHSPLSFQNSTILHSD